MNIARVPIIRTLSLGDVVEAGDEDGNGEREAEGEMNIQLPSAHSFYLPNQLDNKKVNFHFRRFTTQPYIMQVQSLLWL